MKVNKKRWEVLFSGLLLIVSTISLCNEDKTFVIGCRPCGLFSSFFGVINNIGWCERNGHIPTVYWDKNSLYYTDAGHNGSKNPWEYYFEPISDVRYLPGMPIHYSDLDKNNEGVSCFDIKSEKIYKYRLWGNKIINKYIKVKKPILDKVDSFYKNHMHGKKTIGIHLRGTDKYREEKEVDVDLLLARANEHSNCQYLVATDEQALLDRAIKELNGPVIFYNAYRSLDGKPIHFLGNKKNDKIEGKEVPSMASLGEDIVIEVLLLSRCDFFIHTCSNVSAAVMYFSPRMPHVLFLHDKVFENII